MKKAQGAYEAFYDRFGSVPLLSRMDTVMEYFIDEYETLRDCGLSEEEREEVQNQFSSMYVTTDIYKIYNWFLEENDLPLLPDAPKEERVLRYEDVFPLLYFKCRLYKGGVRKDIRHLVIDEMQDYSYLQYVILERCFPCNMTILGDRAQTIDAMEQDVLAFLPGIFGKKLRKLTMDKGYRNTLEIAEYAKKYTDAEEIRYLNRHGKAVSEEIYRTEPEALEAVLSQVKASGTAEGQYETAAVIFMTEGQAKAAYDYIRKRRADVSYIDRDSRCFRKGISVAAYYMVKGLEFDQVFVLGGDREHAMFKNFRYISATRALHELYVCDIVKESEE